MTKYYIKPDGAITKDYTKWYDEYLSPIRADGTVLSKHENLHLVIKDSNGEVYSKYKTTPEADDTYLPDTVAITADSEAETLAIWKADRELAVSKITVETTDGNIFDGDEISQGRLSRAISVMDDVETTVWVLNNNSVIDATKAELKEALKLAGKAQTALWVA